MLPESTKRERGGGGYVVEVFQPNSPGVPSPNQLCFWWGRGVGYPNENIRGPVFGGFGASGETGFTEYLSMPSYEKDLVSDNQNPAQKCSTRPRTM